MIYIFCTNRKREIVFVYNCRTGTTIKCLQIVQIGIFGIWEINKESVTKFLLNWRNRSHIQTWLYKGFGTIVKTFFSFFLSSSSILFHDMEWTTTYHHHNLNATTTAQSKICRKPFLLFFFEVSSKTGQKSYAIQKVHGPHSSLHGII